jgi:hypothetical protein
MWDLIKVYIFSYLTVNSFKFIVIFYFKIVTVEFSIDLSNLTDFLLYLLLYYFIYFTLCQYNLIESNLILLNPSYAPAAAASYTPPAS